MRRTRSIYKSRAASKRTSKRSPKQSERSWGALSPKEKALRVRALEVIRLMRTGHYLTAASRQVGIDPRTAKAQLRGCIYKRRGRWKAKAKDKLDRGLVIYERGRQRAIVVNKSETATMIGQYLNDVKKVLETGNIEVLEGYRKAIIVDAEGKKHKLELRLEAIKEIELAKEEVEFADIYAY